MKKLLSTTAVLAALALSAPRAEAVELAGTFGLSGSVTVSATTIDWFPPAGTTGTFVVGPPALGYFADPGNALGPIWQPFPLVTGSSLDLAQVATAGFATAPINTNISVPNFLSTFAGNANPEYSDLAFELTFIPLAAAPACAGNIAVGTSCSIGPFLITQSAANQLTVSLSFFGIFTDPSLGLTSLLATGAYSTQGILTSSTGGTIGTVSALLTELFTNGGSVSATYSATYTVPSAVPEPTSLLLFGTGAAMLAQRYRRRRKA